MDEQISFVGVPTDKHNYPAWNWPDKTTQLLFDIGYSYSLMREAEMIIKGLYKALEQSENRDVEANQELRKRLGGLLAQMENFRACRLSVRDDIYSAGYVAGAKLQAQEN
jgi:hypothetical protein